MWILFDIDNGHYPVKNYFWRFDTREAARKHRDNQSKLRFAARLIGPYRCEEGNKGKALWAFDSEKSYGSWFTTKQDAEEYMQDKIHDQYRRFDHSGIVSTRCLIGLRRYERPKEWKKL